IGRRSLSATGFWLLCIVGAGWLSRDVAPTRLLACRAASIGGLAFNNNVHLHVLGDGNIYEVSHMANNVPRIAGREFLRHATLFRVPILFDQPPNRFPSAQWHS